MSAADNVPSLTIAAAVIAWVLYDLPSLRGEPDERALWVALAGVGLSEAVHVPVVYDAIDGALGPGWGTVVFHLFNIVVGVAALDLLHQLNARSPRWRLISLALAILVAGISVAPWMIAPPASTPPGEEATREFFNGTWVSAAHWSVVVGYLVAVTLTSSTSCARAAAGAATGRVRTGMTLISVAGAVMTVSFSGHIVNQVAWFTGRQVEVANATKPGAAATGAVGLLLLVFGSTWTKLGAIGDRLGQRWDHAATAARVEQIRPHWTALVAAFPEVSPFQVAVRAPSSDPCQLLFQQSRMVIEVYDVRRRLDAHLDDQERARIASVVHERGLRGATAYAVAEQAGLTLALRRHAKGCPPLGAAASVRPHAAATTTEAARHIAAGLRRAQRQRECIEAVIAAVPQKEPR